jgi:hypothetical protein
MALIIPENYRTSEKISSSVARVCTALRNGLDDSAVAWVEPPFDPSGTKPHLVVLIPDHGIAVIEVLEVRASKLLGSLRGKVALERDGKQVEIDPLGRAEGYAETLRQRVAAEPRLAGHRFPVAAFAAFPSLDESDANKKGLERSLVKASLFREGLEAAMTGDDDDTLGRALARRLGVADVIEGDLVDLVRGLIQPMLVIGGSGQSGQLVIFRPPDEEDVVAVMDRRQEALAKGMAEGHRVVRGVAGSGKTLVLVHRARLFAEMYPDHRFLVTCFTRSLASQLRLLLADYPNIEVTHLHRLMDNAIRSAKMSAPTYKQEPSGDTRAEVAVKALEQGALTRYRAVFVDEAQDFGTNALIFARSLADTRYDDLLVVADAAQNIFRRKFSWKQAGINAQGRTRILRVNYRNTREVLELASGFLFASKTIRADENPDLDDESAVVPPRSAARTGPEAIVTLTNHEDLVRALIAATESFVSGKSAPRRVALLYVGTRQGREIAKALDAAGVEYFWAADPDEKGNRDRIAETLAPVVLSTVASAKGLEFRSVVLSCTARDEDQDLDELRMTIYVGMTRATEQLAVFADESHPLAGDLRAAAEAKGRLLVEIPDE